MQSVGRPDPDYYRDSTPHCKRTFSSLFPFLSLLSPPLLKLGYSALVGLGVLVLAFPVQYVLVKVMFDQRKKGVKITDQRVRLTTEVRGLRFKPHLGEELNVFGLGFTRREADQTLCLGELLCVED